MNRSTIFDCNGDEQSTRLLNMAGLYATLFGRLKEYCCSEVGQMLSKVLWSFGHSYRLSKGCFWPNPAVRPSIAACQVENPAVAATGRYRP
jgi:hypothetical protein